MLWLVPVCVALAPPTRLASVVADAVFSSASVEVRIERTEAPKVYGRAIKVKNGGRRLQLTY